MSSSLASASDLVPLKFEKLISSNNITRKNKLNISVIHNVNNILQKQSILGALLRKDIETAKKIIEKGADVNQKDKDGNTALIYASKNEYIDIVNALLEKGADVNQKDKDGNTALIYASSYGYIDIVNALLEKGVDVNQKNKDGSTALIYASISAYIDIVNALLEKGADIDHLDDNNSTALIYASKYGYKNIVNALLEKGADVDKKGENTYTALIYASRDGYKDIINALLEKGADVDQKDKDGSTALIYASKNGYIDIVNALLEKGADIDYIDNNNNTALNYAVEHGYTDIVNALNTYNKSYYSALNTYGRFDPITKQIAETWKQKFKIAYPCDKLGYKQHKGECWIDTVQEIFFFTDGLKEITQSLFYTMTDEDIEKYVDEAIATKIIQGDSYTVTPNIPDEPHAIQGIFEPRIILLFGILKTSDKVKDFLNKKNIHNYNAVFNLTDRTINEWWMLQKTEKEEIIKLRSNIIDKYPPFIIDRRAEYIRGIRSMRDRFITHYDFIVYNKEILTCENPVTTKRMYKAMQHTRATLKRTQSAQLSPNLAKALQRNDRRQSQTSETDYKAGDWGERIFPILLQMFHIPFTCNLNPSRHTGIAYGMRLIYIDKDRGIWNTPNITIKKINSNDEIWASAAHAFGFLKCNNIWYYYNDNSGVSYLEESLISAIFIPQPKNVFKALYYNVDIQKLFLYLFENRVPKKLEDNSWEQTIRMKSVWRGTQFIDIEESDMEQFYEYNNDLNGLFLRYDLQFIDSIYSIEPLPVSSASSKNRKRHPRSTRRRSTRRRR